MSRQTPSGPRPIWAGAGLAVSGLALCGLGAALLFAGPARDRGTVPYTAPPTPVAAAEVGVPGGAKGPTNGRRAAPPVRLEFPSLDVTARVVPVSVAPDGQLLVPNDPARVGWWRHGARPGEGRGSVVLDGHLDSARLGLGTFVRLRELDPGDPVHLATAAGRFMTYRVTGLRQYPKAELPAEKVFSQDVGERLVLITCAGRYDRGAGGYQDNLVVYAVPSPPARESR